MLNNYFKEIIKKLNILLAYSGGIDSTFLLYQLLKLQKNNQNFKFRAIHINHQLHPNSEKWSLHCKQICKLHNIPIIIKKIFINKKTCNGIEEKARMKRYTEICKALKPKEIIVTGHNLNDQCETMFLALKRGSGITGLSGMSYLENIFNTKKIIRPLLKISRFNIQKWIQKHNISWIEDTSNYNINHDRNFIRHKIIPKLNKRWPYFENNCSKSIEILNSEKNILNTFVQKKLKHFLVFNSILNVSQFKNLKKDLCNLILRNWIKKNYYLMPSFKITNEIYQQIILSKKNSQINIQMHNYQIRKYRNYIYWIKNIPNVNNLILIWKNTKNALQLPYELGYITLNSFGTTIPYPKQHEIINIRFSTSKKFLINKNAPRKTMKKMFKEHKIPPWYRKKIPLLFYNNCFISALGMFVVYHEPTSHSTETIQLSWKNYI